MDPANATPSTALATSENNNSESLSARQASAVLKVLNITELLELVLLHLPCLDLLKAQSVCRTWRSLIENSRKIQTALYLEPVGPVMDRAKLLLFSSDPYAIRRARSCLNHSSKRTCRCESAQRVLDAISSRSEGSSSQNSIAAVPLLSTHIDADSRKLVYRTSVNHPDYVLSTSTFRNMFVTQPPTSQIVLGHLPEVVERKTRLSKFDIAGFYSKTPSESGWQHSISFPREGRELLKNPQGVTMGQLVDHFTFNHEGAEDHYFHFFGHLRRVKSTDQGDASAYEE